MSHEGAGVSGRPPAVRCCRGCPGCPECPGFYAWLAATAGRNGHEAGRSLMHLGALTTALASASLLASASPDVRTISEPAKTGPEAAISEAVPTAKRLYVEGISEGAPAKVRYVAPISEPVSAPVYPAGRCQRCGGPMLQAELDPAEPLRCLMCGGPSVPARAPLPGEPWRSEGNTVHGPRGGYHKRKAKAR